MDGAAGRCCGRRRLDQPVVQALVIPLVVVVREELADGATQRALGADRVIFLPDEFLGRYVAERTAVEIILWQGHCEVHERFRADELRDYRKSYPGIRIFAHPECPPDVLAEADYVGSTSGMIRHVDETRPERVVMVTECSMSDNVAVAHPEVEFVRPCNLCPHMKQITLPKILVSLERMRYEVTVEPDVAERARLAVERMLAVGRGAGG